MERFWRRCLCAAAFAWMFLVLAPSARAAGSDCSHVYETITEAATCTEPGISCDKCRLCGKTTNYVNIPATGHSFGEWTVTEVASCSGTGLEVRQCSSCGYQEENILDALGHSYASSVVLPTCGKQGYTLHTCSVCADSYKSDYVDPEGHSYESSVLSPTCTKQGYTLHTCSVCADSYKSDYVDALGHFYGSSVISPTCEKQGYTHHACSLCGETYKSDYVDAVGHSYTAQIIAPTRTARGYTLYTCSVCQDSYKADYKDATGTQTSESTETTGFEATDSESTESASKEPMTIESTTSELTASNPTDATTGQVNHTSSAEGNTQLETAPEQSIFMEANADSWYNAPIHWLRGRSTGVLLPLNREWTRAQFVTLLWQCCGSPKPGGNTCPYADLKSSESCYDAVLWAYQLGIARGIDAHRFAPSTVPARRHVVSMLYWVFGEP